MENEERIHADTFCWADNLMAALRIAIKTQSQVEHENGYTGDSGLVAGWKANLQALREGDPLRIKFHS